MNIGQGTPILYDNDTVTFIALPIQLYQSSQNNSYVLEHNVLLKSLPDGNFVVDANQFANKPGNFVAIQGGNKASVKAPENVEQLSLILKQKSEITPTVNTPETAQKTISALNHDKTKPKIRYIHCKSSSETALRKTAKTKKEETPKSQEKVGPFKCQKCNKEFQKWVLFRRHEKTHMFEKKYKCNLCSASYNILTNFLLHEATHNTTNPTCPECGKKFQRIASLKAHLMHHEKEETFYCQECDINFSNETDLNNHVREHGDENKLDADMFQCKYCQHVYTSHSEFKKHMSEHSKMRSVLHSTSRKRSRKVLGSDRKFTCPDCNKKFQKHSQIERHMRVHSGEKPYKCLVCGRAFSQKGSLKIHMSRHDGQKPHKCSLCPAKFSQKGNLRAHILKTHSVPRPGENVYSCSECSCVFKKIGSLNGHMTRNHPEQKNSDIRAVMSQLAEMQSSLNIDKDILQEAIIKSDLPEVQGAVGAQDRVNMATSLVTLADLGLDGTMRRYVIKQRRVGDIRWHQCPYCSKEFKKPSDLVRHLRVHTREKPFKCKQCFRSFAVKSTLTTHIRTHSGVKEYKCKVCSKSFMTLGSLNVHLRSHSVQKPHVCTICNKSFRSPSLLKQHFRSHAVNKSNANKLATEEIVLEEPLVITSRGILSAEMPLKKRPLGEAGSKNRPYQCTVCSAAFRKLSHLKQHHVMHTGDRFYNCPVCYRKFSSNGTLKAHILTHNGTKPFKCMLCNKNFTTNGSLRRHLDTHNANKPVLCPYCYKTFKTVINCRKHMKMHKNEVQVIKELDLTETDRIEIPSDLAEALNEEAFTLDQSIDAENIIVETPILDEEQTQEVTHTIQADETGTVVLPVISRQENFTQENIQEIEDTLNHQMLNIIGSENFVDTTTYTNKISTEDAIATTDELVSTLTGNSEESKMIDENNLLYETVFVNLPTGAEQIQSYDQTGMDNFILSQLKFQNDPLFMSDLSHINMNEASNVLLPFQITSQNEGQQGQMIMMTSELDQDIQQSAVESSVNLGQLDQQLHLKINPTEFLHADHIQDGNVLMNGAIRSAQEYLDAQTNQGADSVDKVQEDRPAEEPAAEPAAQEIDITCNLCKVQFKTRKEMKTHRCLNIVNVKITGDIDKDGTFQNQQFILSGVDDKVVEVNDEGELTTNENGEETQKNEQRRNQCTYCVKSFRKPSDLIRHIRTHTGERPFKCKECAKCFSLKSTLESHIKVHQERKDFVCQVCNCLFATNGSLKVHMRLHTGAKPFKCPVCHQKFRTSGHRKAHLMVHYKESLKLGKGPKAVTSKKANLTKFIDATLEHLTVISDKEADSLKEPIVISTEQLSSLQINENILLKTKQGDGEDVIIEPESTPIFEIQPQNQLIYIQPTNTLIDGETNLEIHAESSAKQQIEKFIQDLKTAEAEKLASAKPKHICEFCGKEFSMKYLLERHVKIHTDERGYKCTQCKQTFHQKGALSSHMRVHMNNRPYACPHCSNAFCQSGHLKTHIKRIHGIKVDSVKSIETPSNTLISNQISIPVEFNANNIIIQTDSFTR